MNKNYSITRSMLWRLCTNLVVLMSPRSRRDVVKNISFNLRKKQHFDYNWTYVRCILFRLTSTLEEMNRDKLALIAMRGKNSAAFILKKTMSSRGLQRFRQKRWLTPAVAVAPWLCAGVHKLQRKIHEERRRRVAGIPRRPGQSQHQGW